MGAHPIENIMKTTMENIRDMIDVNTIVGEAVETSTGAVIIPISKVSFGFVSGGGEYGSDSGNGKGERGEAEYPFAGGTGAGVSLNPVAFLVINGDQNKLLSVSYSTIYDRIIETVPDLVNELKDMLCRKHKNITIHTSNNTSD